MICNSLKCHFSFFSVIWKQLLITLVKNNVCAMPCQYLNIRVCCAIVCFSPYKWIAFFGWLPNRMLYIPFLLLLERGLIFHLFIHTIAVRSSNSYKLAEILQCPVILGKRSLLQVHVYIWDKWVMLETVIMNNGSQFQILATTHLEFVAF